METIDRLLTPQIKSDNVTYSSFTENVIIEEETGCKSNTIRISSGKARISGLTAEEVNQGKKYLKQLQILFEGRLPECEFEFFSPAYGYRGFLIDVVRHFIPIDELKRIINVMSLAGFNVFHWHLTDDQGWRFKVPGYDKLETISSTRKFDEYHNYTMTHSGIYSDEDLKEIVDFCAQRNVNVVPEIELPGHAEALLAAYPQFGCTGKQIEVQTKWGIFENVMNPASEELWTFIETAIGKLASIFPYEYICIGGDECIHGQWDQNEECLQLIKRLGISNSNELQGWFTSRAAKIVASHGKRALGWDEVVDAPEIDKSVIVMSWRGLNGAKIASSRGHNVILCPEQGCYMDKGYTDDSFEPKQWGTYSVKDTFNVDVSMKELPQKQRNLILGAQCNIFCEQMHNGREVEYMMFPRVFALADNLWLGEENKNWEKFKKRRTAIRDLCWNLDIVCSPARWEK